MIISKQAGLITILWIISLIVFFLYLWPSYPDIQDLSTSARQKSEELNREKDFSAELENILIEKDNLQNQIQIANSALPIGNAIPELITQVVSLNSDNSLTLTGIDISNVADIGQVSYKTLSVTLKTRGDYNSFKLFLKALENHLRIIDVNSISFKSPLQPEDLIEFEITFKTYYQ